MNRPVEEFQLEDVNPDEFESTVGDTTGAVGGTPAETNFGVGQIITPSSIEWETKRDANISSESQNSIQDLNFRLNLLKQAMTALL